MILHVTFSDKSNPWVSFSPDRKEIAKQWRQWMKNHPETARPCASSGGYYCIPSLFGGYMVQNKNNLSESTRYYKKLGNALAALEKLGGEKA